MTASANSLPVLPFTFFSKSLNNTPLLKLLLSESPRTSLLPNQWLPSVFILLPLQSSTQLTAFIPSWTLSFPIFHDNSQLVFFLPLRLLLFLYWFLNLNVPQGLSPRTTWLSFLHPWKYHRVWSSKYHLNYNKPYICFVSVLISVLSFPLI